MKLYLYILIIWFTVATYRAGFKFVHIDGLLWVALAWFWIFLISWIAYLFSQWLKIPQIDIPTWIGILIAAISLVVSSYFIINGMQLGFKVATFTPAYAITSAIFIYLIWILFFKDEVVWQNTLWLTFWILAIYFLSIK